MLLVGTTDNGGMTDWANQTGTSDPHWPASVGCNWPYRGTKGSLFQVRPRILLFRLIA